MSGAGRQIHRIRLGAEYKRRACQDPRQTRAYTCLEIAVLPSVGVKGHWRLEILFVNWPPECAARILRAQVVSAEGGAPDSGRHMKMRLRIGVSLIPATLYGPSTLTVLSLG